MGAALALVPLGEALPSRVELGKQQSVPQPVGGGVFPELNLFPDVMGEGAPCLSSELPRVRWAVPGGAKVLAFASASVQPGAALLFIFSFRCDQNCEHPPALQRPVSTFHFSHTR